VEKVGAIFEQMKNMGVLTGKGGLNGNVLRIKPPMCITKDDVNFAIYVMREVIHKNSE
jgi:alanine-glyoxylate transaminase/(R)-3-amino-2-methylpropionate-pyruvate transaminase